MLSFMSFNAYPDWISEWYLLFIGIFWMLLQTFQSKCSWTVHLGISTISFSLLRGINHNYFYNTRITNNTMDNQHCRTDGHIYKHIQRFTQLFRNYLSAHKKTPYKSPYFIKLIW